MTNELDFSDDPFEQGPAETTPAYVAEFVCALAIAEEPAPECIIEDAVYRKGITVLAGESGAGKSFVSFDLGTAVAEGVNWHGRGVTQGSVAYVAFEADALPRRFQALQRQERNLANFYLVRAAEPLSPMVQRDGTELPSFGEQFLIDRLKRLSEKLSAEGLPPIALLVVDTVRASLSGSEDSSADVSAYLRAVRRILATIQDAGALLVHHTGWQDGEQKRKRERGSSAFRGNVEVTLYLEVADDTDPAAVGLELRTLKARDSERRAPLRLIRRRIDLLAFDKFGEPLSSCVIERDLSTREDREAKLAATAETEAREVDRRTLQAIAERPDIATSQDSLRQLLHVHKSVVGASISRLIERSLIRPGGRGRPYEVTPEGRIELNGGAHVSS